MPGAGSGFMRYRAAAVQPVGRKFYKVSKKGKLSTWVKARVAKVAPAVKAYVKSAVKRTEEKKFAGLTLENGTAHNAAITAPDIVQIIPTITQGDGYNQRSGDKIRPTSLIVDGCVSFNDYGQGFTDTPVSVLILVLQAKRIRDPLQVANAPINVLLDRGTGATSWDGSTLNSMFPINRDEFEILGVKRVKLSDTTAENTRVMSQRYQMNIKCPAQLTYGQGSTLPNNFAPFFVLGWSRDDAVIPAINEVWVKNTASSTLYYTDA